MGNHHMKNHSAVHLFYKDKKDFNAFQIFSKNSDKNLKISWLGVESNHWLTVFTRCSTINPEELLSYHNHIFKNLFTPSHPFTLGVTRFM